MWIFSTLGGGGGLGQIHTFMKVWKKGVFYAFSAFLPFFAAKLPEIFHTLGGGVPGDVEKNPHLIFFEGFPYTMNPNYFTKLL